MAININIDASSKQNKLVAGTNITIDETNPLVPIISASDEAKLDTIAELQAYSGSFESVTVSDLTRGGTFIYQSTGFVHDGGVVFTATGKGSGFWVRQRESNQVNVEWFGLDLTGLVDETNALAAINTKYNDILFPYGVLNASFNNNKSNMRYESRNGFILASKAPAGGVVHLAIGKGPSDADWLPGDTVNIVENVRWVGTLITTSRVGSYYCRGLYFDDIQVIDGAYLGVPTTPRGVHFHYGSQLISCKSIQSVAGVAGDYAVGINGSSSVNAFTGIERTEDIYIDQIIGDSVEIGLLLNKVSKVNIGTVDIRTWGGVSNVFNGAVMVGCVDSHIGILNVNSSQNLGTTNAGVYIGAANRFTIGQIKSINNKHEGVTLVNTWTDSYYTVATPNKQLRLGQVVAEGNLKSGIKIQGSVIADSFISINNNYATDANAANIFFSAASDCEIGKVKVIDDGKTSNALTILNSTNITVTKAEIDNAGVFGVYIPNSTYIKFHTLKVNGATNNLRYDTNTDNLYIGTFQSSGATTRDIANVSGTNVSIGFKGGVIWFQEPFADVGFVKLNQQYASTAPTSLVHRKGHVYLNGNPSSAGFVGWVCTASGTPGTWKTFGVIS
tara:strand:+ start:1607 stop:3451 length:1845 start_codon:yes stop_codon:yes gene_type:complete